MPGQLDKILTARSTQLLPTNSTPSHAVHELTIHFLLVSIFSDKTDIHHIQLYYSKIYIYENSPASTEPAVVPSLAYFCPVTGLLLADVVVGVCPMPAVASAESAAVSGMAPSRLSSSWLIRSRMPCSWCRKYRDSSLVNCFGWLFTVFTITSVSYNTNATNDLHQCMKLPKVWIIINLVRLLNKCTIVVVVVVVTCFPSISEVYGSDCSCERASTEQRTILGYKSHYTLPWVCPE